MKWSRTLVVAYVNIALYALCFQFQKPIERTKPTATLPLSTAFFHAAALCMQPFWWKSCLATLVRTQNRNMDNCRAFSALCRHSAHRYLPLKLPDTSWGGMLLCTYSPQLSGRVLSGSACCADAVMERQRAAIQRQRGGRATEGVRGRERRERQRD